MVIDSSRDAHRRTRRLEGMSYLQVVAVDRIFLVSSPTARPRQFRDDAHDSDSRDRGGLRHRFEAAPTTGSIFASALRALSMGYAKREPNAFAMCTHPAMTTSHSFSSYVVLSPAYFISAQRSAPVSSALIVLRVVLGGSLRGRDQRHGQRTETAATPRVGS
jgi:hypothetical protein